MENEDDQLLNTTELPEEITGEVFNIRNDKFKINVKWHKQYTQTQTFSSFDQDKNTQAVFLENPEHVELTMWTLFPHIELLLHETNQYAFFMRPINMRSY